MIWWLLGILVLACAPIVPEILRRPMRGAVRATAKRTFIRLRRGLTHDRWYGPEDGALVVCVHGLTTPSFVWNSLAPAYAAKSYRVLVYDHYGRGYSDRPYGRQDRAFFVDHLSELLAALDLNQRFELVGYSMGGAIAAGYAADFPQTVRRLVLLTPAGMHHAIAPKQRYLSHVPLLGDWLFHAVFARHHRHGTQAERSLPSTVPNMVDLQQNELRYRGFIRSVMASLWGILAESFEPDHRRLATQKTAVVAIWGRADAVIPIDAKDMLAAWNPSVRHHVIADTGHGLTYTHTNAVLAAIFEP